MRLMQRRGSAHWTMRLRLLRNTRAFRLIRLTSTHFYFYILENLVEFGRCCCCFCVFDTIFGLFANRLKSNFWFCQCYYRFSQVLSRGLLSSLVITFKFYVFIFIFSEIKKCFNAMLIRVIQKMFEVRSKYVCCISSVRVA